MDQLEKTATYMDQLEKTATYMDQLEKTATYMDQLENLRKHFIQYTMKDWNLLRAFRTFPVGAHEHTEIDWKWFRKLHRNIPKINHNRISRKQVINLSPFMIEKILWFKISLRSVRNKKKNNTQLIKVRNNNDTKKDNSLFTPISKFL